MMFGATATPSGSQVSNASSNVPLRSVARSACVYKPRKFENKGALLTLFWNFSALVLFVYFIRVSPFDYKHGSVFIASTIFCPFAGWLADVYFGRYRVIKLSMFIMFLSAVLYVVLKILEPSYEVVTIFQKLMVGMSSLALGAFHVNALQFGIDQLIEASSEDISSYISWYAWCFFFIEAVTAFSLKCACGRYSLVASLFPPILLSIAMCLDALFSSWLIKEPVSVNPLKLIFKVLRYAVKHKYPRQRSAFTYWDDKRFSRIDLGKNKYGGPFTTEQVEDVKTFFRIMVIVLLGCLFVGLVFVVSAVFHSGMLHYRDSHFILFSECSAAFLKNCFERVLVTEAGALSLVFFIPLFELVLYPFFWKYFLMLGIMRKFLVGMFIRFLYHVSLLMVEVIGHHVTSKDSTHNANFTVRCLLKNLREEDVVNHNTLSLDYQWLTFPEIFSAISTYCLLTSTIEFVCAQSPYAMRGLIFGILYGLCGLAAVISYLLKLPFQHFFKKEQFRDFQFGCGMWYYLSVSILTVILIGLGCAVTKCYMKRRRDENIHNAHIFAVNYFDRYSS